MLLSLLRIEDPDIDPDPDLEVSRHFLIGAMKEKHVESVVLKISLQ